MQEPHISATVDLVSWNPVGDHERPDVYRKIAVQSMLHPKDVRCIIASVAIATLLVCLLNITRFTVSIIVMLMTITVMLDHKGPDFLLCSVAGGTRRASRPILDTTH